MQFTYITRTPGAPLNRFVESIWYARGRIDYPSERIAPTGSTVAVIVLGAPIVETPANGDGEPFVATTGFLIGPHDRPVINAPTGETYCVGVVATPVGCQALFGVAPAPLRGRVVDLASIWTPAAALRRDLLAETDPDRMLDLVDAALSESRCSASEAIGRCERVVRALEADPTRAIGEIAAEVGVSHGHLNREFTAVVGLSPRALARILRLRGLLAELDVYAPVHWSSLAARYGWFDQSHLIRDFKRHTGVTPSEYVAAQRTAFTPEEAGPGFVPLLPATTAPDPAEVKSVQDRSAAISVP